MISVQNRRPQLNGNNIKYMNKDNEQMDVNRKIRIDGDYLQSYQDDYIEIQIDKMNQRMTFFLIIFIILLGIISTFGFFYIRNNVQKVPQEVNDLSHQVVESMSTLSERHTQMESTVKNKLSLLEKVTEALRKDQKEIQDAMDRLNRTKADQNDIGTILDKANQDNYKAIEEVRDHINTMNKTFTKQFETMTEQFQTFNQDVNDIVQNSIVSIQKDFLDQLKQLSTNMKSIESDIESINARFKDINSRFKDINSRFENVSSSVSSVTSSLETVKTSIEDMIDSEKLEELLSIEREDYNNRAKLNKALMDNHIKILEEKLENIRLQLNHIQSRKKKIKSPKKESQPIVQQQLPVKTKKKNLLPKTTFLEPEEPASIQDYSPPKSSFQPVEIKPPVGKMIEEDLSD